MIIDGETVYALGVRHRDGRLHLFLRVVRAPSGIYIVFAAGQHRPGIGRKAYNPHSSWHKDGRVHHKSYDRPWIREKRQGLDGFRGAEPFIVTSVDQMLASGLPECNPAEFTSVMEVPVGVLDVTPGHQQVHVDIVAPGSVPPTSGFGEYPLMSWWLSDGSPSIVVSVYKLSPLSNH
jgi:hypothetical protein